MVPWSLHGCVDRGKILVFKPVLISFHSVALLGREACDKESSDQKRDHADELDCCYLILSNGKNLDQELSQRDEAQQSETASI